MLICVGSHICRGDIADTAIVETVSAETADTDVPEVSDAVSTEDAEIPSEDDVPDARSEEASGQVFGTDEDMPAEVPEAEDDVQGAVSDEETSSKDTSVPDEDMLTDEA